VKILPKKTSTKEVPIELQQPSMLANQNYNEYLFDGGADYMINEARASIRVTCDYDLLKLKGGSGSMYSQAHNEFMAFIEQAQPAFPVNIEDSGSCDFAQTTFFYREQHSRLSDPGYEGSSTKSDPTMENSA